MADSDDNQKFHYLKSHFLPGNFARRWRANGIGVEDDDSNNLFMSEPSVSEADELSDNHLRLLSPLGSFTEDEDHREGIDFQPPPPPPAPRPLTFHHLAPTSPGNTSLSSWESPHWNQQQRIHVHFSPGGDSFSQKADASVQSNPQNQYQRTSPYLSSANPLLHLPTDPYLASGLIPPSTDAKTPERSYVQSSNSTSPASEGQRRRLEAFLDDLRVNSQGQVQQTIGTNVSFGSSTYQGLFNQSEIIQDRPVTYLQPRKQAQQQSRSSVIETTLVENNSGDGKSTTNVAKTDESVFMFLSDDSGDETKHTTEASRLLDSEEKASADDEKTTEKRASRTIRSARSHGAGGGRGSHTVGGRGHCRQRSGDAAAATLSTGSKEWKGMEQDKIPLPPLPGGQDDDEDEDDEDHLIKPTNSNIRGKEQKETKPTSGTIRKKPRTIDGVMKPDTQRNTNSTSSSGPLISQAKQESNDFAQFALGSAGTEAGPSQRKASWVRQRRESYRGRKLMAGLLDSEDSSSFASADQHPHGPRRIRHASLPASTFSGYFGSPDLSQPPGLLDDGKASLPIHWSPQSMHSPRDQNDDRAHWQTMTGSLRVGQKLSAYAPIRSNSLEFDTRSQNPRMSGVTAWGHNSTGSVQSVFSWISDRNQNNLDPSALFPSSEMSPLMGPGINGYETNNRKKQQSEDSVLNPPELEPEGSATYRSNVDTIPSVQQGKISFPGSPFTDLRKRFAKSDRRRFLPSSGIDENDDEKYPTFVCPVCQTRQREFFTVSNAPRQFESASGYIAFYFGIYVIAALYIFGLQEGWGKLDCIYFAVITLTTAGLGDFVPTSDGAKVVCSIFIYFGVACIGLLLGSYIAGMLDESSRRAAHANRIKSCPNCVRIQNIRDAAERRRSQYHKQMKHYQHVYDMTPVTAVDGDPNAHDAKRVKRQHHRVPLENQVRGFSSERHERNSLPKKSSGRNGTSVDLGFDIPFGSFSPIPAAHKSPQESSTRGNLAPSQPSLHESTSQSPYAMLYHRSHSRHASFDLTGSQTRFDTGAKVSSRRKFSADLGVPGTIEESAPAEAHPTGPPPSPTEIDDSEIDSDNSVGGDEISTSSSETTSETSSEESSLDLENQYNGVKNARYVFLTLREALVNSLVIIGTGCFGFYFIEGFSFIDSWYFTTVLLTTVGYGDLVPYTKGGKLFATVYILVAGTILLNNMSMISMIPLELRRRRTEKAVLTQFGDSLDDSALRELATGPLIRRLNLATDHAGGLDECTREMFCLAMLVRLGKVTEEDIKLTFAAFKKLDVHDEKVLNSRAIIAGMIQKRRANLELNKGNGTHSMSNQSSRSITSYGSLPSTAQGTGFARNRFDRNTSQDVGNMAATFNSTTPEGMSGAIPPESNCNTSPFWSASNNMQEK